MHDWPNSGVCPNQAWPDPLVCPKAGVELVLNPELLCPTDGCPKDGAWLIGDGCPQDCPNTDGCPKAGVCPNMELGAWFKFGVGANVDGWKKAIG